MYLVSTILAFLGGLGLGAYYGMRAGVEHYYHLENVLSSSIDILRSNDLRGGSEKELKHIYWEYETSISSAIDSYLWYQESGNKTFARLFFSEHLEYLDISIRRLAKHRTLHPIEGDSEALLCDLPESQADREYCLRRLKQRQTLVDELGSSI